MNSALILPHFAFTLGEIYPGVARPDATGLVGEGASRCFEPGVEHRRRVLALAVTCP